MNKFIYIYIYITFQPENLKEKDYMGDRRKWEDNNKTDFFRNMAEMC